MTEQKNICRKILMHRIGEPEQMQKNTNVNIDNKMLY